MGMLKYYLCPWNRKQYDKMFPRRTKEDQHGLSAEELAELRRKAREEAKRLEEMMIKNPETQEWRNYKASKERKLKMKVVKEKAMEEGEEKKIRPKTIAADRTQRLERRRDRHNAVKIKKEL